MDNELKQAFWKNIESDRTVMIGPRGRADATLRPMTAQVDDEGGKTIYFFASREEGIGADVRNGQEAVVLAFASKGHDLFAGGHGKLREVSDAATIDRLWSPMAGLFYEDGRDDPKLMLLRLDDAELDIWRSTTTGFLKSIAWKLSGKDAGEANPEDRGVIAI